MTIGDLARDTGVSARAIRHYEQLGLLPAAPRSPGGYRLYRAADATVIRRIRLLQSCGLPLKEIHHLLAGGRVPVLPIVLAHLERVEQQIASLVDHRSRLRKLADGLNSEESATFEELLRTFEENGMLEKHLKPQEVQALRREHEKLGAARHEEAHARLEALVSGFAEFVPGEAYQTDERAHCIVREIRDLMREFTGGDQGLQAALLQAGPAFLSHVASAPVAPQVAEALLASLRG